MNILAGSTPSGDPRAAELADLLQPAFDNLPIAVLLSARDGSIVLANREAAWMFQYSGPELIGLPVDALLPDALREGHAEQLESIFEQSPASPASRSAGVREVFGRRKDGSELPIEISLAPLVVRGTIFIAASVIDITERRRHQELIRSTQDAQLRFETMLGELGAEFITLRAEDVDHAIEEGLGRLVRLLELDRGTLFQLEDGTGDFVFTHQWTRPGCAPPPPRAAASRSFPWALAQLRAGELIAFSELDEVPDRIDRDNLQRTGTQSAVAMPIIVGGRSWGAVAFASVRTARTWTPALINRLRLVAFIFASAQARRQADELLLKAATLPPVSRPITVAAARTPAGSPIDDREVSERSLGMADPCDLKDTLLSIIDEHGAAGPAGIDAAVEALDRIRRHTGAAAAVIWIVDEAGARCVARAGAAQPVQTNVTFAPHSTVLERLRRDGVIRCSAGEVSGVEDLMPLELASCIAAAAPRHGHVAGVLVLGWTASVLPWAPHGATDLRIAASLLIGAFLPNPPSSPSAAHEVLLNSFADRIAIIDRDGTIIAANATWIDFARRMSFISDTAVGVNYFDTCRRTAEQGSADALRVLDGVMRVCTGSAQSFEMAYEVAPRGETRHWLMRVTPLRRPEGGAIVSHLEVTGATTTELTRTIGDAQFRAVIDTVRVPVFTTDAAGRLLFGNASWKEATGDSVPAGEPWAQACHPDDRDLAHATIQAALAARACVDIEVRLLRSNGTYRWWVAHVAPRLAPDGDIAGCLAACQDVTPARQAQQALRDAGARLIAAQEAVRSRIARELHDDLGQQVVMMCTRVETLLHQDKLRPQQLRAGVAQALEGLQDLARAVHDLSHELHPAKLRLLGLQRTIAALARDIAADSGVPVTFQGDGTIGAVPDDRALCIFRIAQEALQNAAKHSGARLVQVGLLGTPTHVSLRITDDGVGFDTLSLSSGLGLTTMRERVELIGGTLRIHTSPASGTTIEATVPLGSSTVDVGTP